MSYMKDPPEPSQETRKLPGSGTGSGSGPATDTFAGADTQHAAYFDHERLDVYRVARDYFKRVQPLLKKRISRSTRDQLERASLSIVTNIAEGAGKTAADDKRKYYESARGSTNECAGVLDTMTITGSITESEYQEARALLLRVSQMLSRMCGQPRTVK